MKRTIEEFKNTLELLVEALDVKKAELSDHLDTQDSLEGEEAISAFDTKTATLIDEITELEEQATKEYKTFNALNPKAFNLEIAKKSVDAEGNPNTNTLEELLNTLAVKGKFNSNTKSDAKKTPGMLIGEYLYDGLKIRNVDDAVSKLRSTTIPFKFQLATDDITAEAEVKSLDNVKGLYINGGTELVVSGTPVPGFQGYGCSVFEIEDGCLPCITPRNYRDLLTMRVMPTGNIIQYDFPYSRDDNAAAVREHIHNPYPTVVQNGRKPESVFTYHTAKVGLSKIAHWIEASTEVLDDCSKVAERIDYHLTTGVENELDRQLIAGTGTNGELLGLLQQPGKLVLNGTTITSGVQSPNIWDKLYTAMIMLEQNCARVDGVIVNPADRAKVALAKDDNGNYLFPQSNTCDFENTTVGCLTLRTSPDVPVGTALIGEFANNWIWYARKAYEIAVGMKGTDFIDNIMTFRAELRGGVVLRCPERVALITNI